MYNGYIKNLVLAVGVALATPVFSQYVDGGLILGGSLYEGDLAPNSIGDKLGTIRPLGGLFFRKSFDQHWAARISVQYGTIMGNDATDQRPRNLSFRSGVTEIAATVEFSFPGYDPDIGMRFSPYGFIGIAYFNYNPTTEFQGQRVELQPLGTEGQGLADYNQDLYRLNQFSIPFGGGIKYSVNPSLNIGIELGPRVTFTDYLDDVSSTYASYRDLAENRNVLAAEVADRSVELTGGDPQERRGEIRGNPNRNDWYLFTNITISYNFYDLLGGGFGGGKRRGCPVY
ncbi:MAG: DUF6089 family protein [Saprospiraceae bacterium]|nr:DUF6089 family protein [Saprospiraceae bacterium]